MFVGGIAGSLIRSSFRGRFHSVCISWLSSIEVVIVPHIIILEEFVFHIQVLPRLRPFFRTSTPPVLIDRVLPLPGVA